MSVEVYPNIYNVDVYESVVYVPTALELLKVSEDAQLLSNKAYVADSSSASLSLVLPLSSKSGDSVEIVRYGSNAVTVSRNGHRINGSEQDLSLAELQSIRLRYVDSTIGWINF